MQAKSVFNGFYIFTLINSFKTNDTTKWTKRKTVIDIPRFYELEVGKARTCLPISYLFLSTTVKHQASSQASEKISYNVSSTYV